MQIKSLQNPCNPVKKNRQLFTGSTEYLEPSIPHDPSPNRKSVGLSCSGSWTRLEIIFQIDVVVCRGSLRTYEILVQKKNKKRKILEVKENCVDLGSNEALMCCRKIQVFLS